MIGLYVDDYSFDPAGFALSDIISIDQPRENEDGATFRRVYLRKGREVDLYGGEVDRFFHRPVQIMPAGDDQAISWMTGEDDNGIMRWASTPLIGWALCLNGRVLPLTAAGVVQRNDRYPATHFLETAKERLTELGSCWEATTYPSRHAAAEARRRADSRNRAAEAARSFTHDVF